VSNFESFALVLATCVNLAALEQGNEVDEVVVRIGLHSNVSVGIALMGIYAECGSIEDAHTTFDKMPKRDIVSCDHRICHTWVWHGGYPTI
jgi:pentatricopeptide repeat protein